MAYDLSTMSAYNKPGRVDQPLYNSMGKCTTSPKGGTGTTGKPAPLENAVDTSADTDLIEFPQEGTLDGGGINS